MERLERYEVAERIENAKGAVVFERCDLSGVDLGDMDLRWVKFLKCDMSGVSVVNANLNWCEFISCDISNVNIGASRSHTYSVFKTCYDLGAPK